MTAIPQSLPAIKPTPEHATIDSNALCMMVSTELSALTPAIIATVNAHKPRQPATVFGEGAASEERLGFCVVIECTLFTLSA